MNNVLDPMAERFLRYLRVERNRFPQYNPELQR